ncbi:flagellar biosynthesis protein FlhB [Oscillospiraceae bacterium PP1C4]
MAGEKTEKATSKRKSDERKKGNIFQSKEIVTVFSLAIVFYSFKSLAPNFIQTLKKSITDFLALTVSLETLTTAEVTHLFVNGCTTFAIAVMPLLLISGFATVILTMAQTRMLVSFKSIQFKGNRMNPLEGIKKMFSMRGFVELIKSLIKIIVLSYIIFNVFKKEFSGLPRMMDMTIEQALMITGSIILSIVKTVVIIFAFLALFDYVYQWWEYEKNLRMSKQEIKEEYKQTEGDPQIKGKIKERQQQQARKRMMQNVPNADVVIRNPTHFAVAIQYQPEKNHAPVVIAKGADRIALKIVEIAEKNNIIITENKPLARGLYDAVELDQEIPDQFYQAVAEVLAFVYSLKKKDLK